MSRAVAAALVLVAASHAAADIRLWEEHAEEPARHRYFDLTGYLQPGFIARQFDEFSPITEDLFWLQRARIGFRGKLQSWLFVQFELETTPAPVLNDAFIEARIHPSFNIRAGQFQLAFLRTFQFGEPYLAFIDRTIFTPQSPDRPFLRYLTPRDVGLMFTGRIGDQSPDAARPVLEYWLGSFVGRGSNQIRNDNEAFLYSARVQAHLRGVPERVEEESDLARNRIARISTAAGVYSNCDDRGQWNRGFTVDSEFRYEGLFASAAFVWFRNGPSEGIGAFLGYDRACKEGAGAGTVDHIANGASAQVQYVLPEKWFRFAGQSFELLARWDWVNPNSPMVAPLFGGSGERRATLGERLFGGGDDTPGYVQPPSFGDADNAPSRWRMTAGINWFPTSRQTLRISANYQWNLETEPVRMSGLTIPAINNNVAWIQMTAGI